jgi:hypothetical protein
MNTTNSDGPNETPRNTSEVHPAAQTSAEKARWTDKMLGYAMLDVIAKARDFGHPFTAREMIAALPFAPDLTRMALRASVNVGELVEGIRYLRRPGSMPREYALPAEVRAP